MTSKKDNKLIWASYQYNVKTGNSSCILEVLINDRAAAAVKYTCEISNMDGIDTCHAHVKIGDTITHFLPFQLIPHMWLLSLMLTSCGPVLGGSKKEFCNIFKVLNHVFGVFMVGWSCV